ncbi:DUF2690 domain-containing protein [Kitasatospora sp. NPDC127059]|uniref:DUF2690 domain-containing protein n=1 Tax=unclassified Kitasatospora TaxID=2633591 RepID=UPI00365E4737
MSQSWKPLPDDLSEPARRLAEELRAVKDAHRISLAELGKRTYLSKASWERWLNGKRLITSQALDGLIAAVDCDAELLTSLLRQAEAARDANEPTGPTPAALPVPAAGSAAVPAAAARPVPVSVPFPVPVPVPVAVPATVRGAGWRRTPTLVVAAVAAAAVLVLLAGLYLHGRGGDSAAPAATAGRPAATATQALASATAPAHPLCQGLGCAGKDPAAMGCEADDRTLLTGNIGKVVLYVHYSPRCRAAWAGITDGAPGDTATITTGTGGQETARIHWGFDNYSMMVDAGAPDTTLRVCGHQPDGDGCTGLVTDPATRADVLVPSTPTPVSGAPAPVAATPTATPGS